MSDLSFGRALSHEAEAGMKDWTYTMSNNGDAGGCCSPRRVECWIGAAVGSSELQRNVGISLMNVVEEPVDDTDGALLGFQSVGDKEE